MHPQMAAAWERARAATWLAGRWAWDRGLYTEGGGVASLSLWTNDRLSKSGCAGSRAVREEALRTTRSPHQADLGGDLERRYRKGERPRWTSASSPPPGCGRVDVI